MSDDQVIALYREMADLTLPKCKQCHVPLSCCSPEYCGMAIEWAKEEWRVKLVETGHPKLPLMGPDGCTVDPHFRSLCTLHVCCINNIGCDPKDASWTKRYFELRERIMEAEHEREQRLYEAVTPAIAEMS